MAAGLGGEGAPGVVLLNRIYRAVKSQINCCCVFTVEDLLFFFLLILHHFRYVADFTLHAILFQGGAGISQSAPISTQGGAVTVKQWRVIRLLATLVRV